MSDLMTLADVLGRDLTLQWYEAVAVVRAVAERLPQGLGRPVVPDLQQIVLSADGSIDLTGGAASGEPVPRLGQLLQALLVESESPVQLRLVISQATAPVSAYGSIAEYGSALAFFERPNRRAVLQSLYQRASAASMRPDSSAPRTVDSLVPPAPADREPVGADRRKTRPSLRRPVWVGMTAVAIAALGAAAIAYARVARTAVPTRLKVSAAVERASDVADRSAIAGVSAITERLGLGRLVPAETVGAAPARVSAPGAVTAPRRRRASTAFNGSARPLMAFDIEPRTLVAARPNIQSPVHDSTVDETVDVWPTSSDATIYSTANEGVSPPVAVRPALPRELPSTIHPDQLARIDLVVAPNGHVESVKLVGSPRNVKDVFFLSVAKAWEFQPAVKDGLPVRYRKTIWVLPR